MINIRVFISGIGIISPLGQGINENKDSIKIGKSGIKPLTLFHVPHDPLPCGEITTLPDDMPRTHALALFAAKEAVGISGITPDAIIIGSSTGGMPLTENLIKEKNFDPLLYKNHSTGSIAEYLARELNSTGLILTVSTACSSGAIAIKLALELIRSGMANNVLAGGADALCRLTYHGFNSLQLIDPAGCRPFDEKRKGMSVAEGAAMLMLSGCEGDPPVEFAEILGAGLSCDAYHPASPHPGGAGAADAMRAAIRDAGLQLEDIDYVNLHGTGTIDNDLSEARALRAVFGVKMPRLSSTKGLFGHSLGASGAIEAMVSVHSIKNGIIPANTGCEIPDPALNIRPELMPLKMKINSVLSNSFGFGGNNASVVFGNPRHRAKRLQYPDRTVLSILGKACITGAGNLKETVGHLEKFERCGGLADTEKISEILPKNKIRRLKRLPRMVLSLAAEAYNNYGGDQKPSSIFFGTGWGALTETFDFLEKLYESGEQFPSPTDFIGSVHNAPAGQVAMWFGSKGANITATGGDYSFEQALLSAELLSRESNGLMMVIGADEYHEVLSSILDESAHLDASPSDGGGALLLSKPDNASQITISVAFLEYSIDHNKSIKSLAQKIGPSARINDLFGAVFAGIPACMRMLAQKQLYDFKSAASLDIPVINYRKFTGEFASASAAAAVIASEAVLRRKLSLYGIEEIDLNGKGILMIGLGDFLTAVEILRNS